MPSFMIDEKKNLVESQGFLLDERKNLVKDQGYVIDEKKNLVEYHITEEVNMIKKSFTVTKFNFDGTPTPVSFDATGLNPDKFICGILSYDHSSQSVNSIILSDGMCSLEVVMNIVNTKDGKTGVGKVLNFIILGGNIMGATLKVLDGTTTEPSFPIEGCVINLYFEE